MAQLVGRTALVTGGGRGLGSAIATAMAAAGAHVLVVDRNTDAADEVVQQITAGGGSASAEALEIGDRTATDAFVAGLAGRLERLDVLVNNAGIAPRFRPGDADERQKWDQTITVNLTGQWDLSAGLLPLMRHRGASMVFVSSIAGFTAPRSSAAYGASKAAVRSLVQYFSRTLGPTGGRANGLAPGRMASDLLPATADHSKFLERVPLGRIGETHEIAGPAVFLASDMSSYVTGVTIPVDGGYLAL